MSKLQDADLEAGVPAGAAAAAGKKAGQAPAPAEAEAEAEAKKKTVAEEDPRLRWAFVRKVYAILSLQFAVTAAVSVAACLTSAVPRFFISASPAAFCTVFVVILVSPLVGTAAHCYPPAFGCTVAMWGTELLAVSDALH
jgi:FtsH-binding integral membrane protein